MCCCLFFLPSMREICFLIFCYFSLLVFRPEAFFHSLSLFLCFPHPSLFFLFMCFHFLPLFSFSVFISSLIVPALSPDPGYSCGGAHVNIFVLTCLHFGLVCDVSTHSHSGQLIRDMHFGITHLVPHRCSPAIIVYVWDLHLNSRGEHAFSLAWLSLWTFFTTYNRLSP